MDTASQLVLAVVGSTLASSGFWAFVMAKGKNRSALERLMMGIAYDKITTVGVAYLERGWMSREEYEELQKYYYEPYKSLGGNGVAERIMNAVDQLPFTNHNRYAGVLPKDRTIEEPTNVRIHVAPSASE